ncbi:MAG: hypothetical protein EOO69_04520 [Moraxellaceae bacterium]|nr:MAG: hypothetical protein EOO69_04520 [Moraxellaceae bacterium]
MAKVTGGNLAPAILDAIAAKIQQAGILRVGFLESETYPDGLPVAQVAFWNEYGAEVDVPAHQTTVYRSIKANGDFNKNGRFVRRKNSNYATVHDVPAHKIVIPARPFFRKMIETNKSGWSLAFGNMMKANDYDVTRVFNLMGEGIKDQLTQSIVEFSDPANAASTARKKGFNNPLIDTGVMQKAVGYEIK